MKARLMDELAVFATKEREITFCFDYETRPETQRNIEIAISRTGRLLESQGASVSVVTLPGPSKGVDDLIVAQGALAYEKAFSSAVTLKTWRDNNNQQRHASPAPPKKLSDFERKQLLLQRFRGQLTQMAFKKAIDALTDQQLLYLEQAVKEYFDQPLAQVPAPIDRQAIESEISHLQPQIDSLWLEHAHQEKAIRTMELFPLHQLSNKYNEALEQQLQTIGTIKELVAHKHQLQLKIQEYETKRENHHSWEKEQQTVEMKTMAQILKSPELQSRLTSIKDEIELKQQQLQARLSISRQPSPQPRRGLRR
ncbi:DUF3854 domain-containing protein [Nostoc linckia FACHB-104]|nr:DUF3854 domain-containing protein [Nostoc linckia FACHB-104]